MYFMFDVGTAYMPSVPVNARTTLLCTCTTAVRPALAPLARAKPPVDVTTGKGKRRLSVLTAGAMGVRGTSAAIAAAIFLLPPPPQNGLWRFRQRRRHDRHFSAKARFLWRH